MYTIKEIKTAIANCNTTVEVQKIQSLLVDYSGKPLNLAFKAWLFVACKNRKFAILKAA
nr:hypothetical protein [uncultured Flavobacterium sp.]